MRGRCCDLSYCRIESVELTTVRGAIWPPSEVYYHRWKHMHYIDPRGQQQRERGCFWQAIIPGRPEAGNQSTPYHDDPMGLQGTFSGLS